MSVLAGTDHFRELEEGYGGDVYGKRYLPGPLHMLMGDVAGALASFDCYEDAYHDDFDHAGMLNFYCREAA